MLNGIGDCVYLLHYTEDRICSNTRPFGSAVMPFRYNPEIDIKNLDYSLVENFDLYIFSELEEYTYVIARLLREKYPLRKIYFLDDKISYFPELSDKVEYIESVIEDEEIGKKRCLWINSEERNYEGFPPENFMNIYNSINVISSMFWCGIRECFGEKNKDCSILLVDTSLEFSGLIGYITFVYRFYLIAKMRKWKFAVDLSHKPNQYLINESDNMWDYFFEPLSDLSLEEVYNSNSVIRLSANSVTNSRGIALMLPYIRWADTYTEWKKVMKTVRFNEIARTTIAKLLPEILRRENNVLGVIIRGTDYTPQANKVNNNIIRSFASIDKMIKKSKFIMRLYGYDYIFLATEDLEYFLHMRKEFGDKCIYIDQKRVYHDYKETYIHCSTLLDIKSGRDFGMRYLAVIQSLANCRSLLANTYCGATMAAIGLNDSKYEYCEVVKP